MVDLVHLQEQGVHDIVVQQLEVLVVDPMLHIAFPGKKEADLEKNEILDTRSSSPVVAKGRVATIPQKIERKSRRVKS